MFLKNFFFIKKSPLKHGFFTRLNGLSKKQFKSLNYNIPSDISSSAFFIVLTALTENAKLVIKNVNINSSRTVVITILKMMGVKIYRNKDSIKILGNPSLSLNKTYKIKNSLRFSSYVNNSLFIY